MILNILIFYNLDNYHDDLSSTDSFIFKYLHCSFIQTSSNLLIESYVSKSSNFWLDTYVFFFFIIGIFLESKHFLSQYLKQGNYYSYDFLFGCIAQERVVLGIGCVRMSAWKLGIIAVVRGSILSRDRLEVKLLLGYLVFSIFGWFLCNGNNYQLITPYIHIHSDLWFIVL